MFLYNIHFLVLYHAGIEMVGPRWRVLSGTVSYCFWLVGYVILAALAYFIRDWTMLLIAGTIVGLPYFAHIWY